MTEQNGHAQHDPAVTLLEYLKDRLSHAAHAPQTILSAICEAFLMAGGRTVDRSISEVIRFSLKTDGISEMQLLKAYHAMFQPKVPLVYPDQFNPRIIIHPDGHVLWEAPPTAKPSSKPPTPEVPLEVQD